MTDGAKEPEPAPEPTRVARIGLPGALFLYANAALLCLFGPVMLAFTLFTDSNGTGTLLTGILCTVFCAPLGLAIWGDTLSERENNQRLDAVGVAATAEVTGLTDWDDGEDSGVVVALRISTPGCPPFETTWKRSRHPALRVGLRLKAVVDPTSNLFRVEF
ncbi:hypothetical protein [Streptomyces sp. NBC_00648]|uniref:hypothetical protein n=1 Tax=Streptomyces sp. NBC_00648 TaxID=2975797 RepID=UPI003247BC5A